MTTIDVPDYVTMITPKETLTAAELAQRAADLLTANPDLPAPENVTVSVACRELSFLFPGVPASFKALAQWAERFGGTIIGEPHVRTDGTESVYCTIEFFDHGVHVEAYAFVGADQAATAAS